MHSGWPEAQVHTRGRHHAENSVRPMNVWAPHIEAHGKAASSHWHPLTQDGKQWVSEVARDGICTACFSHLITGLVLHCRLYRTNYVPAITITK
jgi:hypothetical protein